MWIKTTKPGLYGMAAHVEHTLDKKTQKFIARLEYGHALPLQYFDRLLLANKVFGDDIKLRAIVETPDGPSIETSQPDIDGQSPTTEAIADFMTQMGFAHVPSAGPTWYRAAENILLMSASSDQRANSSTFSTN